MLFVTLTQLRYHNLFLSFINQYFYIHCWPFPCRNRIYKTQTVRFKFLFFIIFSHFTKFFYKSLFYQTNSDNFIIYNAFYGTSLREPRSGRWRTVMLEDLQCVIYSHFQLQTERKFSPALSVIDIKIQVLVLLRPNIVETLPAKDIIFYVLLRKIRYKYSFHHLILFNSHLSSLKQKSSHFYRLSSTSLTTPLKFLQFYV